MLEFERIIMQEQIEIALVTSVDNKANVRRIVNFYYHPAKRVIYFSSFSDNQKIEEFKKNLV